jgi:hypothetical protein
MKLFYFVLLFLFIALASCNTSYFSTANNMRNMMGKAYTTKGDTLDGEITVNAEGGFGKNQFIRFKSKAGKEEKIPFEDIKEVSVRNEFYVPKKLEQEGLFGNNDRLYLMKRLTKAESKIQLYEHTAEKSNRNTNSDGTVSNVPKKTEQYYISLPNMNRYQAYNIERKNVIPHFDDKVSEMVKDCSVLASKIKNKDKGYFYALISFNAENRIDTWFRIIEEYNGCR